MEATQSPQYFIEHTLIVAMGNLVYGDLTNKEQPGKGKHPYFSFVLMGIGIEFLGKCMDTSEQNWDALGAKGHFYKVALENLVALNKYQSIDKLSDVLRNGLAHRLAPKSRIRLTDGHPECHLRPDTNNPESTILNCESLYEDFKLACKQVCESSFPEGDKMKRAYLDVSPVICI